MENEYFYLHCLSPLINFFCTKLDGLTSKVSMTGHFYENLWNKGSGMWSVFRITFSPGIVIHATMPAFWEIEIGGSQI